jgi:hypothetical protein
MTKNVELPLDRYNELLKAERGLTDLSAEFDAFEECGGECQELRTAQQMTLKRISAIKRHYGPKTPGLTE